MNPKPSLLWAALVLSQSCLWGTPQSGLPLSDRNPPTSVARVEIPFKLYRGYFIVVQGSLGALQGLNFLIDTGVDPTVVDRRIAKKLRLAGGTGEVALFNQDANVGQVLLPSIQIGPIRAEPLPAMTLDLSSYKQISSVAIDAIVGLGVLSRSSFSIDYRSKKLVFGPVELSPSSVPFDTGPPLLTVQLQVKDQPVRVLLDSGASELVLFECALRGRLRWLPVGSEKRLFFNGVSKQLELTEVWLPKVRLGATDLGFKWGLKEDDSTNCNFPFDGILGITRLRLKRAVFDFERRIFSWQR